MARIRTIKPEVVESESLGKLSRESRLLFILLWTFVDDDGRSRASSRLLASRLYPYDEDAPALIGAWLEELELGGHVRLYEVEGDSYLDIPKWLKHQKIDHPSKSRLPEFREGSRESASHPETFAPHTLDLGPVPRTKDLVPIEGAGAPKKPKPEKKSHAQRLPDDWQPTQDLINYARDRGLDPVETAAAFKDHWAASNTPTSRKLDWDAAFRTWCRNAQGTGPVGARPTRAAAPARGNDAFYHELAAISDRSRTSDQVLEGRADDAREPTLPDEAWHAPR